MEKLSESNATVQAFPVSDAQSTSEIQSILGYVREHYPHPPQFLVVCSLECTQEVLSQVVSCYCIFLATCIYSMQWAPIPW